MCIYIYIIYIISKSIIHDPIHEYLFLCVSSLTVWALSPCWSVHRKSSEALRQKSINGTVRDSAGSFINACWESTCSSGDRCDYWLKKDLCLNNYWNVLSLIPYHFICFILVYWVVYWSRLIRILFRLINEDDIAFTRLRVRHLVN